MSMAFQDLKLALAFPTWTCTARKIKKLLNEIIPHHLLPEEIKSEQRSHFSSQVVQQTSKALSIKQDLHTP